MKIVIISDTYNKHRALTLPPGDVLIHCGDATMRGTYDEFRAFGKWFQEQPHRIKLFVPGNHDFVCQSEPTMAREMLGCYNRGMTFMLVDQRVGAGPLKVYGTPWVPNLEGWAFYGRHSELERRFREIPLDTDILVTHGPPWGILDKGMNHFGSEELAIALKPLDLQLHCFGHIHESYGVEDHGGGRYTVNASNCDERYELVNPPIVVELNTQEASPPEPAPSVLPAGAR